MNRGKTFRKASNRRVWVSIDRGSTATAVEEIHQYETLIFVDGTVVAVMDDFDAVLTRLGLDIVPDAG